MGPVLSVAVPIGVAGVAFLYAAVGHAGASGYIAVLTFAGLPPDVVRPSALVLNITVAVLAAYQFRSAGYFRWDRFWPFALCSVPAAFLGGYLAVPSAVFRLLVGLILLGSALHFAVTPTDRSSIRFPPRPAAFLTGAALGFLSGLTGTGGGIFLTPLMIVAGWATTKETAAVSAPFILVNSLAGLVGFLSRGRPLPGLAWWLVAVAAAAGLIGSFLGSHRFPVRIVRRLLAVVLTIAGSKLAFGF